MKVGLKTKTIDVRTVEIEYLGKKQEALLIMPYGLMSNAPDDSFMITSCQDGNEDSFITYPTDFTNIDELESKEVAVGIPSMKARVKFLSDGKLLVYSDEDINIKSDKNVNIDGSEIIINGGTEAYVKGTSFDTAFTTLLNLIKTHTHDIVGVQAGSSTIASSVSTGLASATNPVTNNLSTTIKGK